MEANKQSSLNKAIQEELEWVRSNAKGQQKKGKARLRSYEALTQQVPYLQPTNCVCRVLKVLDVASQSP